MLLGWAVVVEFERGVGELGGERGEGRGESLFQRLDVSRGWAVGGQGPVPHRRWNVGRRWRVHGRWPVIADQLRRPVHRRWPFRARAERRPVRIVRWWAVRVAYPLVGLDLVPFLFLPVVGHRLGLRFVHHRASLVMPDQRHHAEQGNCRLEMKINEKPLSNFQDSLSFFSFSFFL